MLKGGPKKEEKPVYYKPGEGETRYRSLIEMPKSEKR